MTEKITPAQLDEIEAAAKAATPGPWVAEYGGGEEVVLPSDALSTLEAVCVTKLWHRQADAKHIAGLSPDVALALVAEVRELRAKVEGATQQPAIDTLYGEGASSDLWRAALGLERAYAGFCPTGDHYCLQSVGHYCQGDQQFIEELGEEA